jgi:hypothetical protein
MPMVIQRSATVYTLWDRDDLDACLDDHANAGWLCKLHVLKDDEGVVRTVSLEKAATKQSVQAPTTHVVVSDLVTVEALTVLEYNIANPDNQIEVS